MTTEQPKAATPQEHSYPPPVMPYPHQHYNGAYPPPAPGAYPPPYFAYPQPPDVNQGEGAQNAAHPPYMYPYPPHPGMMYAFPPPGPNPTAPPPPQIPTALSRPKRKQVKMACTNCAAACKRCDESRPCERCVKYGVAETCIDGQRKERKKGVKRGPYKRKNKGASGDASGYGGSPQEGPPDGDWTPNGQPAVAAATTTAAINAVAQQFAPPPEGFVPVFYPPPFMPHPHEGQPSDGSAPHPNGPPMMQYYVHPGGYPPYHPYAHPGPMYQPYNGVPPPPPPQAQPPQTVDPVEVAKKSDATPDLNGSDTVATSAPSKKRSRASKGEAKNKKVKVVKGSKDEIPHLENDLGQGESVEGS